MAPTSRVVVEEALDWFFSNCTAFIANQEKQETRANTSNEALEFFRARRPCSPKWELVCDVENMPLVNYEEEPGDYPEIQVKIDFLDICVILSGWVYLDTLDTMSVGAYGDYLYLEIGFDSVDWRNGGHVVLRNHGIQEPGKPGYTRRIAGVDQLNDPDIKHAYLLELELARVVFPVCFEEFVNYYHDF